jgi:hypothetical protein
LSVGFWVKRFLVVLGLAFAVICTAQLLKGRGLEYSAAQAAIWSIISAIVFTVARFFQARRGQHCAICKDTPEMQQASRGEV